MMLRFGRSVSQNVGPMRIRSRMRAVHASLLLCAPSSSKQPQVIPKSRASAQVSAMMNETNIQKMARADSLMNGVKIMASPNHNSNCG